MSLTARIFHNEFKREKFSFRDLDELKSWTQTKLLERSGIRFCSETNLGKIRENNFENIRKIPTTQGMRFNL
jgi:hypothetical protein